MGVQRIAPASLVALAVLATACAGEPARGALRDASAVERREVEALATPSFEAPDPGAFAAPGSRPRLRHTITLGETHGEGALPAPPVQRGASSGEQAPPPAAPPTYVYPPTYGYGYGYGFFGEPVFYGPGTYGWRDVDVRPARDPKPSPSRPPALGEDWAKPPSYGPKFPFKTAPADPWK
jgi:hypothetical protein